SGMKLALTLSVSMKKEIKQNGSHIKKVVHTVNGMVIMIMLLTGRMMVIPLKTFIMTKVNYAHALKTYNFIVKRV
ncbi:hypothetical protein OFN13_29000, partial [Escherichia coli]|nr:hypothetical protein [Escherichia coli]